MSRKHSLYFLSILLIVTYGSSNGMQSLKQVCHAMINDSLVACCVNTIVEQNIDSTGLPKDLQIEIQKRKNQLNCLLASLLNGQQCLVNSYEQHRYTLSCVPELIKLGADVSTINSKGQSIAHVAAINNDLLLIQFIRDHHSHIFKEQISATDCDGNTPLHYAAKNIATHCMQLLLDAGVDIDIPNEDGRTPLHVAAESGALASLVLLLERGAALDSLDDMGDTPLHVAARMDNDSVVKYLLGRKAQFSIKNKEGKTALDVAYTLGVTNSVLVLKYLK